MAEKFPEYLFLVSDGDVCEFFVEKNMEDHINSWGEVQIIAQYKLDKRLEVSNNLNVKELALVEKREDLEEEE